jgi:hypothetical protein
MCTFVIATERGAKRGAERGGERERGRCERERESDI